MLTRYKLFETCADFTIEKKKKKNVMHDARVALRVIFEEDGVARHAKVVMIQLRDECRLFVADRCAPDLLIFTRRVGMMILVGRVIDFFFPLLLLLYKYLIDIFPFLRKNELLTDGFCNKKDKYSAREREGAIIYFRNCNRYQASN